MGPRLVHSDPNVEIIASSTEDEHLQLQEDLRRQDEERVIELFQEHSIRQIPGIARAVEVAKDAFN